MKTQRPVNLNLLTIHFPIPAIVSILHRISGIILFLMIPLLLWALSSSLNTQESFDSLHVMLTTPLSKFLIWCCLSAFIYHFIAGVRHLLMDVHIGEGLRAGRITAMITMILSILLIILAGFWIW